MSKSLSVLKSQRQNEKRRARNRVYKDKIRLLRKSIVRLLKDKTSDIEKLRSLLSEYQSYVDKASKKGILHKNTASRKKSRLNMHIYKHVQELKNSSV